MLRDHEARKAARLDLQNSRVNGRIPGALTNAKAQALGRHPRTMRRWVKDDIPGGRRKCYQANERDIEAYYDVGGRSTVAHHLRAREERSAGNSFVSRVTFERALKRALPSDERAFARGGEAARRQMSLHAHVETPHRNNQWQMDNCLLDVEVQVPGRSKPDKPWLVAIIDSATRAIVGWDLVPEKGVRTDDLLRVLFQAISVDAWAGPFGGAPDVLVCDNGREFLSDAMTDALVILGIYSDVTDPYAPHQKGKIERFFRTVNESMLPTGARHGGGPRNAADKRYQTSEIPSLAAFKREFGAAIDEYNCRRAHRSLSGRTPLERWHHEDGRPLRTFPAETLAFALNERFSRTVQKDGIHVDNRRFVADELHGLVGEQLEVARTAGDRHAIVVWRDSAFLCTAIERDPYDYEQGIAVAEGRSPSRKSSTRQRAAATRRQRKRVLDMNAAEAQDAPEPKRARSRTPRQVRPSARVLDALRHPRRPKDGKS